MGLDLTHDCWHGAYSSFMRWREKLAQVAGLPPLREMDGFTANGIPWDTLPPSPLYILLNHSDCDGEIRWEDCGPIADELEKLLPKLDGDGGGHIGNYREKTQTFIEGLRTAAAARENVEFH